MSSIFRFPQDSGTGNAAAEIIYLRVPSQYPTMQAAFDQNFNRSIIQPNRYVIMIDSGHQPATGLAAQNCVANHFSIQSDDPVVTVAPAFSGVLFNYFRCYAPELNALFDMNHQGTVGIEINNGSTLSIQDGCGCKNSGGIGIELRTSIVSAVASNFSGAALQGIRMEQASVATFNSSNLDNCGQQAIFVSRACIFNFLSGFARNSGTWACEIRRSIGALDLADFSGAAQQGIWARHAGWVSAQDVICDNCGTWGIQASDCSSIYAEGAFIRGSNNGVVASDASTVDIGGATITGLTNPATSIVVNSGSRIDATDAITATGTPGRAEINVRAFNTMTARGVITDQNRPDIANSAGFLTFEANVGDDDATSFDVPGAGGGSGFVGVLATETTNQSCVFYGRVINAAIQLIAQPVTSIVELTTGALTGTTGTDTKVTLSTHTDGLLYIENRSGIAEQISVTILSPVNSEN